jgi:hypothetical protein
MAGEQNVDKQSGAPQGYIGDTRGQQFIGPNNPTAIKTFPTSVQNTIENLVHSNPEIAKDPTTAQALATHYGVNATVMANAMGYVQMQNAVKNSSQHFNILNMGKDILGSFVGAGKFGLDVLAAPGRVAISAGKGLIQNQIQGWSGDPAFNAAQNANKLTSGLGQAIKSIPGEFAQGAKLYQSLTTPATPEARAINWNFIKQLPLLPAHFFANLASNIHKHGLNWTIGNNIPNLAIALATEGAGTSLLGAEGAGTAETALARSVAADKELVANAESRLIDNPGDTALQAEIKAAQSRLVKHDPAWLKDTMDKTTVWNPMTQWEKDLYDSVTAKAEQAATEAATPVASGFSKSAYVSKNISEFINKYALGLPMKAAGGVIRTTGGFGANAGYIAAMQQAQANPLTAKLWNDTADLNVRDSKGHPISLGSEVATLLGQQGTMMFTPTAEAVNILAQFVVSDPLGKALEIPKMAKSFAGFTGKLGTWYGGLGIRGAGDITRTYHQYDSVRRAIDFIATHGAGDILSRFRDTFSKEVISKLDKASTPQEVLSVLEDLSAGINIVTSRAPTLGWYSAFKVSLTGSLGEKFGTLGNLIGRDVVITKELANQVKEMTGYDISVKNAFNGPTDLAGKVKVAWRQRIALQFRRNPMWMVSKEMTSRKIEVGSVTAIPDLMGFARTMYLPEDEVRAFGDALYAASQTSHEAYKTVYRQLVYESVMRNISAHYAYAETAPLVDGLSDHIWRQVDTMIGADGGGLGGHYVSSKEDLYNQVQLPDGSFKRVGIGENHLGELILPRRSDLMRLNKAIGRMVKSINRTGLVDTFLKTNSDFNTIASVAEHSGKTIEEIATHLDGSLKRTLESGLGAEGERSINVAKGFEAQTKTTMSRVKKLISGDDYKELPPSERVASINAYLERKSDGLLKQYNVMKDAIERNLPLTNLDRRAIPMQDVGTMRELARQGVTFEDWRRGAALEHLWGEHLAVQQMHFELKGLISESFDNLNAIDAQASQIAAMSSASKESAEKFAEAFKNEWVNTTDKKITILGRSFGKRGTRSNPQIIQDLNQAYLDKYFKPMSLSSLGWAERVSMSEVMLNALRAGPFHFFEAFIAESFARNTIKLEKLVNDFDKVTATAAEGGDKVTLLDRQKFLIKNVVGGVVLGFDEAMIKTFSTDRLERLVQDATDVILLNDGILPWGSHAQHDSVTSEAIEDAASAQVWGVDPVTNEPTASPMVRGQDHSQIYAHDSGAGTALYENISRINNDRVLKPIANYAHELITQRGAKYFSGAEGHARFLNLLEERGVQMLNSFDPRFLERFEHSRLPLPDSISTGDPLRDWAKTIAEHVSNLGTGENGLKIYPTIFEQMSTGKIMSSRQLAKWLADLSKKGEPVPNYFPAKEFISPLAKGSRSNMLIHLSDKVHSRLLGPVVNNLSRDPLFVFEYHNEMEKLRPLIANKIYTEDQAQILAQTNATVSMAKFIHNPLDKTMYEQNMRVIAPYYFAKNQAIRRAIRMAGDNPAAYEKYLKINLAITNYISNINTGIKNGTFQVPGGEMTTAVVGSFLNWFSALEGAGASSTLAGQFGLDASPTSSAMSVITTGNKAGWLGELENFLHVPWGPVVTFPAKAIYEYATNHNPHVLSALQKIMPESMNSSMVQDLVPNPVIKNSITGAIGYTLGDTFTNSYVSLNHYVIGDMSNQLMTKFYKELHKSDPNLFTGSIAQNSAAESIINQKIAVKWGEYFAIPGNAQKFQDQANNRTAMLYALKTVAGFSLPVSVNIGARFLNNDKLSGIIKETNPDGTPKYATYFLAVDEFMRRYPNNYFDLVAHTMSTGSSYPETTKTFEYATKHADSIRKYPNILAFAYNQGDYQSDPRTYAVERNLGLRQRETNQKYFDSLNIWTGDQMYNAKEKELLQNQHYVDRKTGGLNVKGVNQLNRDMKTYGQIYNITWLADHNGGRRNHNAYVSYQQLQKAINDPSVDSAFEPGYKDFFKQAIEVRNQYEASFKSRVAAGHTTGRMKSDYYDFWQRIATQPEYAKFAPFINSVMIKLPDPQ